MSKLLERCRCPACRSPRLAMAANEWDANDIIDAAIRCEACGMTYDVLWGVPYLGHFDKDDTIGLIEIAANASADEGGSIGRSEIERIERLLARYHLVADKQAFLRDCPDDHVRASWFPFRYTEYVQFRELAEGIDMRGADVLDVGAGLGYDTLRLAEMQAVVTAVEYNPLLVQRGRVEVPEVRWISAFSHVLPFEDASFDVVCCNAALHHMRDIPTAMHEMLRVLRPGGHLLTTGDPFAATGAPIENEFAIFNSMPSVLLGINESIPTFDKLSEVLIAHEDKLDVTFFTSILYSAEIDGGPPQVIDEPHSWPFSAHRMLARTGGSLAIRAKLKQSLNQPGPVQQDITLRAGTYGRVLKDRVAATQILAPLVPDQVVDTPFPATRQSKFELLNGWQSPEGNKSTRRGYRRARWFLTRPSKASALTFRVRRVSPSAVAAPFSVWINGVEAGLPIMLSGADWQTINVPFVSTIQTGDRFICELRLDAAGVDFDDKVFEVTDRNYVRPFFARLFGG